jgi:hypothetical protein
VFVFDTPVSRFGGYMNNNSGADDATVRFFDSGGLPLATLTATVPAPGNVWVWNGWESTTPISRIEVTGNGLLQGFLWFDDMEMTTVPTPGAALSLAGLVLLGRRRRAR